MPSWISMVALLLLAPAIAVAASTESTALAPIETTAAAPGGEIRVISIDGVIPQELLDERLIRFDANGELVPGLASQWTTPDNGRTWRLALRPELRASDGSRLTAARIATALRRPTLRAFLALTSVSIESDTAPLTSAFHGAETITLRLKRRDPHLPRRLAYPQAGITLTRRAGTGPFRIAYRDSAIAVLARNPFAACPARPETVVFVFERDPARAVYLVEAGLADVAPVSDDELGRLLAEPPARSRLVASRDRDVHYLASSRLTRAQLRLLARAVNRDLIVRNFFPGRGSALGPPRQSLRLRDLASLPRSLSLAVEREIPLHARLLPRILFDWRQAGITARQVEGLAADCRYAVRAEADLPAGVETLYAVTPYWLVSERIRDFNPPSFGCPGILSAAREP